MKEVDDDQVLLLSAAVVCTSVVYDAERGSVVDRCV